MAKTRQKWAKGDVFLIPLEDGTFSVGTVLAQASQALNSAVCAFSDIRIGEVHEKLSLDHRDVISTLFITPDLLSSGDWIVLPQKDISLDVEDFFDMEGIEENEFLGIKVIGSGVVNKFMNAYFGLYPWDGFYKSDYLDGLLISPEKKPVGIFFKK